MLDFVLHNSTFPLLTAFLLGLLTMLSPCPFCSDMTALSYLSRNVSNRRAIVVGSVCYVLGKCFSYTLLALVFILGAQTDGIRSFFETYGEAALGPFLLVMGIAIALFSYREAHHHHEDSNHPHSHEHAPHRLIRSISKVNLKPLSGPVLSFILGAIFALAFCPYSGLLYFGTLIPLTMMQPLGWSWLMPILFGLGDAIPVMILAILFSKGMATIGKTTGRMQAIEKWLRRISIILFIGVGIYMTIGIFGGHHHCGPGCDHDHQHIECGHSECSHADCSSADCSQAQCSSADSSQSQCSQAQCSSADCSQAQCSQAQCSHP